MLGELRQELGVLEVRSERAILELSHGGDALAIVRLVGVVLSLGHRVVKADLVGHVVADVDSSTGIGPLKRATSRRRLRYHYFKI